MTVRLTRLVAASAAVTVVACQPAPEPASSSPPSLELSGEWAVTRANGENASGTLTIEGNLLDLEFCNHTSLRPMMFGDGQLAGGIRIEDDIIHVSDGVIQTERGCVLADGSPAPSQRWDGIAMALLSQDIRIEALPEGQYRLTNSRASITIEKR